MDVEAYYHASSAVIVGRLMLDRGALRFGPLVPSVRLEVVLPLHDVVSIRKKRAASFSVNAVAVEDRRGARFVFEVKEPEAVLLALEARLAAARGSAYR